MIRYLAPAPDAWTPADLLAQARAQWPTAVDVNEVIDQGVAVYFPDDSKVTEKDWQTFVAGYVPTAEPVPVKVLDAYTASLAQQGGTVTVAKIDRAVKAALGVLDQGP